MGNIITPPVEPGDDLASLQAAFNAKLVSGMNDQFGMLLGHFRSSFNRVWHNEYLTPQQIMDAFGTKAANLFTIALATVTMINTVAPGTLSLESYTPPYAYTINEDGTVTIGAKL